MSVDIAHVRGIASLARLRMDDEELERLTDELNSILEYVEELKSLDVEAGGELPDDADPGSAVTDSHHVPGASVGSTRGAGAETPDPLSGGIESVAPDAREGFFVVPPLPGLGEDA